MEPDYGNVTKTPYQNFHHIRQTTEEICRPLQLEDYTIQPANEVSPPKWHLAHTSWFFEELVLKACQANYSPYHPVYSELFNSYYKSLGKHWKQQNRGQLSRPSVKEIYDYRAHVDAQVKQLYSLGSIRKESEKIIQIGIHHEQQHQELLLMDIKYILAGHPFNISYTNQSREVRKTEKTSWPCFDEGLYQMGYSGKGFCYDNESPRHKVYVYPFTISSKYITNGDFLEFIAAGGYQSAKYWLSQGWEWVEQHSVSSPLYWDHSDGQWSEYTLYGREPLQHDSPVCHISYYEASAFAAWSGKRLPTEIEMEIFLSTFKNHKDNTSQKQYHPHCADDKSRQLWCWTSSPFGKYPQQKPFEGALHEYNHKFMCNQFVLKGGSFATPSSHYRSSYRNFFPPQQRWMFSGIRLAKDL